MVHVEELEDDILRRLEFTAAERMGHELERRLRNRKDDAAAALRIWKLIGVSLIVAATIYFSVGVLPLN